eukprot:430334_1
MAAVSITQVDNALREYYLHMGRTDYINEAGNGLFEEYAIDNGFEDPDIETELETDPTDCLLVAFDEDFPLHGDIQGDKRLQAIHNILKHIVQHGEAPIASNSGKAGKLQIDLYISEEIAQEIADIVYKKQLPCLELHDFPEPDLLYFFAVGYVNDIPLLTWFVDAYTIDRTKHYMDPEMDGELTLDQWSQQNPFMKDLMNTDKTKAIKLRAAMRAYSNRLLPRLQYTSPTKINDDIKGIVEYVCGVVSFLHNLLNATLTEHASRAPFCMDVFFPVCARARIAISDNFSESDESDNDNSDHDDPDVDAKCDDSNVDFVDNLKQRLAFNQRCYSSRKIHWTDQYFERRLQNTYKNFRDTLSDNSAYNDYDMKVFPRNKRFGIFVDRRSGNDIDFSDQVPVEQKDEITFFQQLNECDTIPNDHVKEWFIQARRECLIPGKNQRITAQDHVDGQLLTFSFDVESRDEIQCYINWNGQTMRFTGDNLEKILSCLFVESEASIRIQKTGLLTKSFEKNVVDIPFANFCAQIHRGYEHNGDGYRQGQKSFRPKTQPAKLLQLRVYQSKTSALSTSDEILDAYLYAKEHQLYTHDEKTEAPNDDLCLYGFSYVDQPAPFCEPIKEEH